MKVQYGSLVRFLLFIIFLHRREEYHDCLVEHPNLMHLLP